VQLADQEGKHRFVAVFQVELASVVFGDLREHHGRGPTFPRDHHRQVAAQGLIRQIGQVHSGLLDGGGYRRGLTQSFYHTRFRRSGMPVERTTHAVIRSKPESNRISHPMRIHAVLRDVQKSSPDHDSKRHKSPSSTFLRRAPQRNTS
jgi:hypothetical protein